MLVRTIMRPVAILALLWCLAGSAEARVWGPSYGRYTTDDIMHVRSIDFVALGIDPVAVFGEPSDEPWALGYHYERSGIFRLDLDLWRSNGQFVIYSGRAYYPLSESQAFLFGVEGPPLGYHLPPLLVILIVLSELLVLAALAARRITLAVRTVLVAAGVHGVIAVVFLFSSHMEIQSAAVGWLAIFLGIAAVRALRALGEEDDEDDGEEVVDERPRPRKRARKRLVEPPPRLHDDPFRSAPQPPPIATVKPPRPVTAAPVVPDDSADPPRILR